MQGLARQGGAADLAAACHEAAGAAAMFGAQRLHAHYAIAERETTEDLAAARARLLRDSDPLWQATERAVTALM